MKFFFKYLIISVFILLLTSCNAEIDPSAANSSSAIIATIGEYLFAIIVLMAYLITHLIRIAGVASITFALYMLSSNTNPSIINPYLLLVIGFIGLLCIPVKIYKPRVIISKYAGKQKKETEEHDKWKNFIYDIIIGFVSGILLLIIEYFIFQ